MTKGEGVTIPDNFKKMVIETLSKIENPRKLLEVEKGRRGVDVGKLLFIGMADIANFYWCAMKSLLTNREMEFHFLHLTCMIGYYIR